MPVSLRCSDFLACVRGLHLQRKSYLEADLEHTANSELFVLCLGLASHTHRSRKENMPATPCSNTQDIAPTTF